VDQFSTTKTKTIHCVLIGSPDLSLKLKGSTGRVWCCDSDNDNDNHNINI
jgi:hypothetical protein